MPVRVSALGTTTSLAAGDDAGYALESDGTVRAWGAGSDGQLGNGTTTSINLPAVVPGLTRVTAIAASAMFALAVH